MEAVSPSSERQVAYAAERAPRRRRLLLTFMLAGATVCAAQTAALNPTQTLTPIKSQGLTPIKSQGLTPAQTLTPAQAQGLVDRALANELKAAQDEAHPMRFMLHKSTPRGSSTKEIFETRDGAVARLVAINDKPLSAEDEEREMARLSALESDPGLQRHRKQGEDADSARALKVLRVLPGAFLYQYTGPMETPTGVVERFTFKPNPAFSPPDLETQALTAMSGEICVDPASGRVTRLAGHLDGDVDIGWGILGRLNKGGWIFFEQADVGGGLWRMVRFKMAMSVRVLFRTRVFDEAEEETQYAPVAVGMPYTQAIETMRQEASQPAK
jgi:hypothetical protein